MCLLKILTETSLVQKQGSVSSLAMVLMIWGTFSVMTRARVIKSRDATFSENVMYKDRLATDSEATRKHNEKKISCLIILQKMILQK